MKKVCKVCGYAVDNVNIKECPNCGSYDLGIVRSESDSSDRFSRFRLGRQ